MPSLSISTFKAKNLFLAANSVVSMLVASSNSFLVP